MEENKIKSYEVYCRNFSQVIQAESIIMAMGEFWSANPTEEIITVENIEARNEAKPHSSAESKEAIPDAKTVFDKHYEIYRNLEGNPPIPLQAKNTILDAMHDYDSMFEKLCNNQRKMIDKRDEAIKDLQHQLTLLQSTNDELQKEIEGLKQQWKHEQDEVSALNTQFTLLSSRKADLQHSWNTIADGLNEAQDTIESQKKQLEELRKERDYWKQRCEACEEVQRLSRLDYCGEQDYAWNKWQQLKSQKLNDVMQTNGASQEKLNSKENDDKQNPQDGK